MKTEQILHALSSISGFLMTCYSSDQTEQYHMPDYPYSENLIRHAPTPSFPDDQNACCLFTDEQLEYGFIRSEDNHYIMIGPVALFRLNNEMAQRILKKADLPVTDAGLLLSYFNSIPICFFQKFCEFVAFANYVLNGEVLEIEALLPNDLTYEEGDPNDPEMNQDDMILHNSKEFEDHMFSLVQFGRYHEMKEFIRSRRYTGNTGILASEFLRHYKNLTISSTALASRAAVRGGLNYETAMRLADVYIRKLDAVSDPRDLIPIHNEMLLSFTRMVADRNLNNAQSTLCRKVESYVDAHLTEKITGTAIAEALGFSRSYLSSQFKKESGINLSDFINEVKIKEACRLLVSSKRSIADIADSLAFSSQSYFQVLFKKQTGLTPAAYRERQKTN